MQALPDTSIIHGAMPETELQRILAPEPEVLIKQLPAPAFKVNIANGNSLPVRI